LSLDDLMFGFNIWIVCCILPFLTFVCEIMFRLLRPLPKYRKIKFEKIYPTSLDDVEIDTKRIMLKSALIKKFRTKSIIIIDDLDVPEGLESLQSLAEQESVDIVEQMLSEATVDNSTLDHSKTDAIPASHSKTVENTKSMPPIQSYSIEI